MMMDDASLLFFKLLLNCSFWRMQIILVIDMRIRQLAGEGAKGVVLSPIISCSFFYFFLLLNNSSYYYEYRRRLLVMNFACISTSYYYYDYYNNVLNSHQNKY